MDRRLALLPALAVSLLLLTACGGGGGGGAPGGTAGPLQPYAIDAAASPALAADVRNLLEAGDRYQFEPDTTAANALYDAIWARLTAVPTWFGAGPANTFEFYFDAEPLTNWGRAFRYVGHDVHVGPVRPFTAGTYTRPNGTRLPALALQTWDVDRAEFLVVVDAGTIVHAIQHLDGLPIATAYRAR